MFDLERLLSLFLQRKALIQVEERIIEIESGYVALKEEVEVHRTLFLYFHGQRALHESPDLLVGEFEWVEDRNEVPLRVCEYGITVDDLERIELLPERGVEEGSLLELRLILEDVMVEGRVLGGKRGRFELVQESIRGEQGKACFS